MWWDNCQCAVCRQRRSLCEEKYREADQTVLDRLIKKALEQTRELREAERAGEPSGLRLDDDGSG